MERGSLQSHLFVHTTVRYVQRVLVHLDNNIFHLLLLLQHTSLVGGPNPSCCPICQKVCLGGEALMEHMKYVHKDPNASGVPGNVALSNLFYTQFCPQFWQVRQSEQWTKSEMWMSAFTKPPLSLSLPTFVCFSFSHLSFGHHKVPLKWHHS